MRLSMFLVGLVFWTGTDSLAKTCGIQKIKIRLLITRGYATYPGQFPWHVALLHKKSRIRTEYACGGSLISRSYVLTAAHCTKNEDSHEINPDLLIVAMGLHDRQLSGPTVQQHSVFDIYTVSKEGQWAKLKNDIALLKLKTRVTFTDYVQPICLNSLEISNRDTGMVVGWGKTENGNLPDVLQASSMPIISHIECLDSNRDAYGGALDAGMICAGHENGTSVCNGDSGGGLVIQRCTMNGCYWSLAGIVSLAAGNLDGTCRSDGYGAFTNVEKYLPWIKQTTEQQFEDDSLHDLCGQRQDGSIRAKWPWHGTLHSTNLRSIRSELNKTEAFGVTILTNQFVITSMLAYLLYTEASDDLKVRFGHPAIGRSDGWTQEMSIQAAFANTEDREDPISLALFKLKGRLQFTKYVQPICLWQDDSLLNRIVNQTGFVVSFGGFNQNDQPQGIGMPIVSSSDCTSDHEEFEEIFRHRRTFCAGTKNGIGPELLDIGSGLVLHSGNNWFLRGLFFMTFADEAETTTNKTFYAMFLDVTYFSRWITSTIESNS